MVILAAFPVRAKPDEMYGLGGEFGSLFGHAQMANHVPRLGRRSMNPYLAKNRNGFRFFGREASPSSSAGYYGPLFGKNFRFYGGRPGDELARGLLRNKRMNEYADFILPSDNSILDQAAKEAIPDSIPEIDVKVDDPLEDDPDYWKNVLGEATMNSVLTKMVSGLRSVCVHIQLSAQCDSVSALDQMWLKFWSLSQPQIWSCKLIFAPVQFLTPVWSFF